VTTSARMSRAELLALPPAITLAELARAFGVSEPTIRAAHRRGDLERMGIKVNRLGNQHRIVTSSVLAYLGLAAGTSIDSSASAAAGQRGPASYPVR
jgi:hypothetical protein